MLLRFIFFLFLLFPLKLYASQSLSEGNLIRDAEIEETLKSYIEPIFKAAGLDPKSLQLYIIHTSEVNAFAMGGGRIGITTGLLLKAQSALQVIGVLAHETAHLADHHIVRGADVYEKALLQGLLVTLGGVAVGLAGSPEAGLGILLGSQEFAKSHLLKFSRTQESSADQGATRFLDHLEISSKGLLEFLEILRHDDFQREEDLDPYALTHPLHAERIDFFRLHGQKSAHAQANLPNEMEERFARLQVKLAAFTQRPVIILSRYPTKDTSLIARYGRSIAHFQNSQVGESLKELDLLLRDFPQDPYFWDLKGQILFESGRIDDSAKAYEKAVNLLPHIPQIRISWAHALIESGKNNQLERAYSELLRAKTDEPDNPFTYQLLAIYFGKKGRIDLAALSLAEMSLTAGDLKTAEQQAKRSLHLLKNDSVNQARAKDILKEIKRLETKKASIGF